VRQYGDQWPGSLDPLSDAHRSRLELGRPCDWPQPIVAQAGASVFPQNHGYNPTDTVGALAYWTADAIKDRYLRNPGPLG